MEIDEDGGGERKGERERRGKRVVREGGFVE